MTIDKRGEWWVGDDVADLQEYLNELRIGGYAIDAFRASKCRCGSSAFLLDADRDEGAAKRTCSACVAVGFIGDSDEYFEPENAERFACTECSTQTCNIGVGFSLYKPPEPDVRWLSVGVRCASCGVLGCFVDWKVGGGNGAEFLEKV